MSNALILLAFAAPQALGATLSAAAPVIALQMAPPALLPVALGAPQPTLRLVMDAPATLDAALLQVLTGPKGDAGAPGLPGTGGAAPLVSPTLTWAAGTLVRVDYADGSVKLLTWLAARLVQVELFRAGQLASTKALTYNPDGTLAAVVETQPPAVS